MCAPGSVGGPGEYLGGGGGPGVYLGGAGGPVCPSQMLGQKTPPSHLRREDIDVESKLGEYNLLFALLSYTHDSK